MKTVLEIVNKSKEFLQQKGIAHPQREVADLISHCLKLRPLDLYLQYDRPLDEKELALCRAAVMRRAKGEPYQYICGEVEFFGCKLGVNPAVLIPRQETEVLVALIAKELAVDPQANKILWDICTGSGCIGIALKNAFPTFDVTISDISEAALKVARDNAERNEVSVRLLHGDFLTPFAGKQADYIVCNPPYISEEEFATLETEVRAFEPKRALVAQDHGLFFYKQLAANIFTILRPKGKMWLELGYNQGSAVRDIFSAVGGIHMQLLQDWSGHDRFFSLEIE